MLAQLQDWFGGMTWSDLAGLVFLIQLSIYGTIRLWRAARLWLVRWRNGLPRWDLERRKERIRRRRVLGKLLLRNEDWDRPDDETRRHRFQGRCRHRSSWRADPWLAVGRVRPGRRREHAAPRGDRVTRVLWRDTPEGHQAMRLLEPFLRSRR